MGTDLEVALVRAGCRGEDNQELFWIFSRTQIEFVLKELDLVESSNSQVIARYQEMVLPVLSLENYFGFLEDGVRGKKRYLVLRSINDNKRLERIIVPSGSSPNFVKLTDSIASVAGFSTPEKGHHISGVYSLGGDRVGMVPDVGRICQGLNECLTPEKLL